MRRSPASISRLMFAIALVGFHLAVIFADEPIFGFDHFESGLLPGATALAVTLFSIGRRPGYGIRPFAWGFVASLVVAMCIYVVLCLRNPDLVRWPLVYYLNNIEPSLYDADLWVTYCLSREIHGLIFGIPQLLFALLGGALTKRVAKMRRSTATDSRDSESNIQR
jgi:hypothetical protein